MSKYIGNRHGEFSVVVQDYTGIAQRGFLKWYKQDDKEIIELYLRREIVFKGETVLMDNRPLDTLTETGVKAKRTIFTNLKCAKGSRG